MKWLEVEFQGQKYRVPAVKSQGRLWFHWQGETNVVDLNREARRTSREKLGAQSGNITAPMPGKITRVTVNKGDAVKKGQPLVIMEAMKMEYTLEADRDGEITDVTVQPGRQVGLGELLIRVGE